MFAEFTKSGNRIEDDSFFLEAISSYMMPKASSFQLFGNLANISAMINEYLDDINWVGFYLFDGKKLILGPFQGEPACSEIQLARGVCGSAATSRKTLIVPNVNEFPGHIACSDKSKSELVVPIMKEEKLLGVIDIDSPVFDRFSTEDALFIEDVAKIVVSLF